MVKLSGYLNKRIANHNLKHIKDLEFYCEDCKYEFEIHMYSALKDVSVYIEDKYCIKPKLFTRKYIGSPTCKEMILESILR